MGDRSFTRRGLFRLGAATPTAGVAGVIASRAVPAEAIAPEALPQVPRALLGETGARIPILLLGGALDLEPRFDPRLAECARFGVTGFDVAPSDEPAVGSYHARAKRRASLWLVGRCDRADPEGLEANLQATLRRLRTEHVDLLLLEGVHDPRALTPALGRRVEALRARGRLRHFGLCAPEAATPALLEAAARRPWIEVVCSSLDAVREARAAIDAAHAAGVGLLTRVREPRALDAAWRDPRITAAICPMRSLEAVKAGVAAALARGHVTSTRNWASRGPLQG